MKVTSDNASQPNILSLSLSPWALFLFQRKCSFNCKGTEVRLYKTGLRRNCRVFLRHGFLPFTATSTQSSAWALWLVARQTYRPSCSFWTLTKTRLLLVDKKCSSFSRSTAMPFFSQEIWGGGRPDVWQGRVRTEPSVAVIFFWWGRTLTDKGSAKTKIKKTVKNCKQL